MANLSNINNKLIVTDGGNLLVNATANLATYGGITIDNFSDPSIAMKTTGTSGWLWTQYITSSGTNNFSMGVNQTTPYWCVKAGAGMDSPHLVVDAAGKVGIGITSPNKLLHLLGADATVQIQGSGTSSNAGVDFFPRDISNVAHLQSIKGVSSNLTFLTGGNSGNSYVPTERMRIDSLGNVGIKTTPSAWATDFSVIEMSLVGASIWGSSYAANFGANIYQDTASTFKQSGASYAPSYYSQFNGAHRFYSGSNVGANTSFVPTERMRIDSGGSVIIGAGPTSGTPTGDYRSLEIGRQGNTITGAPWKSNLYFSTNATVTAGSTTFTYRYASVPATQLILENGEFAFGNAASGTVGSAISFTERMRIYQDGDITMGQFSYQQAPTNGILKIRTSGSTANVCYPLLYVGGSTHLSTRQYGIGFDPEGYVDRMKMFFGVDGMGNGYSFGDFVWNIQAVADGATVTPADERMRLDKGGDLKLKTGSLVITDTSKGILLGGTSTAHKLGFYKTDTWAPQIYYQNATDQANATNSTQTGIYTKIGNVCTVQFRLIWTQASGTPAVDNIGIKNLPFGGNTTQAYAEVPCSLIGYTGGPSPRGNLTLTLPGANQTLALFNDTNNVGNMGNAIGSGTKEIRFSFTYLTN